MAPSPSNPRPRPAGRRLRASLVWLGAGSVLIAVIALVGIAVGLSASYASLARTEVDALIFQDLDHITTGTYNLVSADGESFSEELGRSMRVARAFLDGSGGIGFDRRSMAWKAVDQFSGVSSSVVMPRMLVGGTWQGADPDPEAASPFVDTVAGLLGITVTLFQRINDRGDMLRVATTVMKRDGTRAIGTYIPAVMADGSYNQVIRAVMDGGSFSGRAIVVDDWYLTAYQALLAPDGKVTGMLYVGQRQSAIEARIRAAIIKTRIGETGYVYVVSGRGENRGRYIVSQDGARDGEDIWDVVDSDGRYVTRDIIDAALPLRPGELTTVRYRWLNPGESEPRWKIARLAYYAPWDWVIGTSAYEDELGQYRSTLEEGRTRMSALMAAAGLAIMLIGVASAMLIARGIAGPLVALAGSARAYTRGEGWTPVSSGSFEVVSDMASAFDAMAERIKETMRSLRASEEKYRSVFENALEGIFRTTFDGAIIDANPAMAHMLGYADIAALKTAVNDIGSQVYARREERDTFLADIRDKGISLGREFSFRKADGDTLWVCISAWALRAENGRPYGIEGLVTDIDARKRTEMALLSSLEQKDELLREVHHRVKNNLQILISLLELDANEPSIPEKLAVLRGFSDRIRAMATIHELVYRSTDLDSVDIIEYARIVSGELHQIYRDWFGAVECDIEGDPLALGLDKAIPCGLLISEILSNSFKHAFPPDSASTGSILVRCRVADDRRVELIMADDGIGLPLGSESPDASHLGMTLIFGLAEQLGADIAIDRRDGTRITISFTLMKAINA